jgi:hypothetical protein
MPRAEERSPAGQKSLAHVFKPPACDDRARELLPGQDRAVERFSDDISEDLHRAGSHAEVALPARAVPRPSRGHHRQQDASMLGGEQMKGASHGPGLDQPAIRERPAHLPGSGRPAPDPDRQLGRGRHLRLDPAQAPDHAVNGQRPDWVEQVATHSPGQGLRPGDLRSHLASLPKP